RGNPCHPTFADYKSKARSRDESLKLSSSSPVPSGPNRLSKMLRIQYSAPTTLLLKNMSEQAPTLEFSAFTLLVNQRMA
ncbi:MAG: hypothetical protein ACP5VS_15630, partial [Desulfomonilaceae bacterium]